MNESSPLGVPILGCTRIWVYPSLVVPASGCTLPCLSPPQYIRQNLSFFLAFFFSCTGFQIPTSYNQMSALLYLLRLSRVQQYKSTRVQEYKSTRVQVYRSTRVQEYKSTRVQEYNSTTVQEYKSTWVQVYISTIMNENQLVIQPPIKALYLTKSKDWHALACLTYRGRFPIVGNYLGWKIGQKNRL